MSAYAKLMRTYANLRHYIFQRQLIPTCLRLPYAQITRTLRASQNWPSGIQSTYRVCQMISFHIIEYHFKAYHNRIVSSNGNITYHTWPYPIISCHVMSCHVISYHTMLCHAISYRIILLNTISSHTISCHKNKTCNKDTNNLNIKWHLTKHYARRALA